MSYHHLALAAKDMRAIHAFYEGVMGFVLVKVEIGPSPGGGWAKHYFYRMGSASEEAGKSFIAFWEMHDVPGSETFEPNLSRAAGLPDHINHIAFQARDIDDLNQRRTRWTAAGLDVFEVDHNWCRSVYTRDPNGNLVEFCVTTGTFSDADRARAIEALGETEPHFSPPPASNQVHRAS